MINSILLWQLGGTEMILIVVVVLLLFGGKKIPELMRGLGKGVKSFKEGVNEAKEEINKASIKFELDDTPGSLATVLNVMNNCKLNLTKIQSMPIIEQPFQYSFFVDVIFEKYKHYEKAKNILALMTTHFKVLGEYKKGKQ